MIIMPATIMSVMARIGRSTTSGTYVEAWLPAMIPGSEPVSREISTSQFSDPMIQWPVPAKNVSGTAWAISEPTIRAIGSLE